MSFIYFPVKGDAEKFVGILSKRESDVPFVKCKCGSTFMVRNSTKKSKTVQCPLCSAVHKRPVRRKRERK